MNAESEKHKQFVHQLEINGYIRSENILRAFEQVDRLDFLPARLKGQAYCDYAIAIKFGGTDNECLSSCSQPSLTAMMLEELDLRRGMSVLDIGTGSGYTSALLCAALDNDADVYSLDIDPELTRSAAERLRTYGRKPQLFTCDALEPWPFDRTFDRILVSAGVPFIPSHWISHLHPDAVIVLPFYWGGIDYLMKLSYKTYGQLEGRCQLFTVFTGLRKTRDAEHALSLNTDAGTFILYDFFSTKKLKNYQDVNYPERMRIVQLFLSFSSRRTLQGFHLYTLAREPFIHGGLQLAYTASSHFGYSNFALYAYDPMDHTLALIPFDSAGLFRRSGSASGLTEMINELYDDWIHDGEPCEGDFNMRFIYEPPGYRTTHPEGRHINKSGNHLHITISKN